MNAILLVAGIAIGAAGLIDSFIKQEVDDSSTIVRISLGFSNNTAASLGGNVPGVALWDALGNPIGFDFGTSQIMPQGTPTDRKISPHPSVGAVAPQYVAISNGGDDAVCIASVTVTPPSGTDDKMVFFGDIAKNCSALFPQVGAMWYYTQQVVGSQGEKPACVWIDRDGSNGIPHQGFGFHTLSFAGQVNLGHEFDSNPAAMCLSGPRFRMYDQLRTQDPILIYQPTIEFNNYTDADVSVIINNPGVMAQTDPAAVESACARSPSEIKCLRGVENGRQVVKRDAVFMEGQLVVSAHQDHSATELCQNSFSKGPDFVSTFEGFHCDMQTRTLTPLCPSNTTQACFDTDITQMRISSGIQVRGASSARAIAVKSYHTTHKWGFD